jgi:hypothetical protein
MNFFGHATVASMRSADPRFVFGAMLPDFCSMAAVRLDPVLDSELARGVALHHETDQVFHATAPFLALCASALATLEPEGVARGSARAVGHVGSELLLDGLLGEDGRARAAYTHSLEVALEARFERDLAFRAATDAAQLRKLLERLMHAPLPEAYREPVQVCDRLYAILARRPRLALRERDRLPVLRWLHTAAANLARDAPVILNALT